MSEEPTAADGSPLGIGTDEWVARHGERTATTGGLGGWLAATWASLPSMVRWGLPLVLAAALPVATDNGYALRIGVNLGLFVILALGLNVVVGYAGLLDLGYVAFYGFGAYAYVMLSSDKFGLHLPTLVTLPIVVVLTALLGLLLGLTSRRLLGDYLAIVTLFFGQMFVELMLSADSLQLPWTDESFDLTGGANGLSGADPFVLFGFTFTDNRDYYYLLLVMIAVITLAIYRINAARVGRAWRAIGEDALAAEAMTIPVRRLKILAFVVGAGLAGLTGTVFAAVQVGAYPTNFDLPLLILLYAAVILGGSGSLVGTLVGATIMSLLPEVLRQAAFGELLFFAVLFASLVFLLRSWKTLVAVFAGVVAIGFAVNGLMLAVGVPYLSAGDWTTGPLSEALGRWLFMPEDRIFYGNIAFVALIVGVATLTTMRARTRVLLLPLVIWLAIFTWEVRLTQEASVTRQLIIGALLIVLMVARPQGIFGQQRVEVL
jgi:ABC-type branched-subunit amino acid transport system permease subunit